MTDTAQPTTVTYDDRTRFTIHPDTDRATVRITLPHDDPHVFTATQQELFALSAALNHVASQLRPRPPYIV